MVTHWIIMWGVHQNTVWNMCIRVRRKKFFPKIDYAGSYFFDTTWKNMIAQISAQSINILTQHTSIEIPKMTKIVKFPYFLTFFSTLTKHEAKIRPETNVTNINELIQRSFDTNVKQVAILCGFAWRTFCSFQTAEEVSALTELCT